MSKHMTETEKNYLRGAAQRIRVAFENANLDDDGEYLTAEMIVRRKDIKTLLAFVFRENKKAIHAKISNHR